MSVVRPNEPLGVSKDMCTNCQDFYKVLAKYRQVEQVVRDPSGTWSFTPERMVMKWLGQKWRSLKMAELEILSSLIQRVTESVRAAPAHDLSLGLRQKIWMLMGSERVPGPGYSRRAALALAAARHVLPLWELKYPQDRTPHWALDLAEEVRVGRLDKGEAQARWQQAWDHMVELSYSDADDQRGAAAGFSAALALRTCLEDEVLPQSEVDEGLRDNRIDAEDMDASMFAAAAYAGGPSWDASPDPVRRLQFWGWWLFDAVPDAYRSVAS